MELLNPAVLLALPIVLVGLYLAWRDNALPALRSRLTLLCRAAICTLLILALADVTVQQPVGDAVAQARLLAARGVQVDVVPLPSSSGPEVLIDQLLAPRVAHEAEKFAAQVQVVSNVETDATVRMYRGEDLLDQQAVHLK